ncbi:S-layer family protein [Desmonostoc muscorum LEGE 12446]|uniref:S-layer family protein n=1 Tax=Desmonostoc muscorum LEGE 12446 TaxID=1828758 RepID=A0A8J7CXA8_DESMC|nr:S-layer family protein [Desmonostoc muscorum]MCF2147042.1 S-layer family protein [Desmonostoc muscorum LEGE 12446]
MTNQYYSKLCLPFGLILSFALTTNITALAQVTADETLGTQVINNGSRSLIEGGTTVDNINLFHSFSSFSIPNGGGGIFLNDSNITNIFARVTGGTASNIQGVIRAQGAANLFLINPNGIIFGENARLNIGGSFVATTANAIQFAGGAEFSLTSPVASDNTLLSINPTAFLFNQIANQGTNSIENRSFLQVSNNKSLILLGGRVSPTPESTGQILMDGGLTVAQDGRVEIGGLTAPGTVGLNIDGDNFSLSFPDDIAKTDISFENESIVAAFDAIGGDIAVNANNLKLLTSSNIFTGITNQGSSQIPGGDISINADGIISLENGSIIGNVGVERGETGNINITAKSLEIISSGIFTSAINGNTGMIDIKVEETMALSGENSIINNEGIGGMNIQAQNILLKDTSSLASRIGDVNIQADESIILSDRARINTDNLELEKVGNLSISTNRLSLMDDSNISAANLFGGNAGDINIKVRELNAQNNSYIYAFSADSPTIGNGGNITIDAEQVFWNSSQEINTASDSGDAGNITFNINFLQLTDGAINAATFGKGNGGNIIVNSRDGVVIDNADISSEIREGGAGNAGNITIQTPRLILTNGSQIIAGISGSTDNLPGGQGKGGNILINAADAVIISGSDANGLPSLLSTQSPRGSIGQAGDITVNTNYFRLENGGSITADTANFSSGGNITINSRVFEAFTEGQVLTTTNSAGNAGNITINATDEITIFGLVSGIFTTTTTNSTGNGGTISLKTNNFNLANSARVFARSEGEGIAGDINIIAKDNYSANNSLVSATAAKSSGGDINITARNLSLRNNSDIRTDLSIGQATGGNIALNANTITALEDSDILAFAPEGQGGNITFNTRVLLTSPLYRPTETVTDANSFESLYNNNRTDINATGAISGNIIGVPDITFIQNSITQLQSNAIDTNALIANSCIARNPKQEGTFLIIGTGGLPTRPGDASASTYPTGDVQRVTNDGKTRQWKKGDSIVEPQGVYRLANGQLVMSRECS